MLDTSSRRAMLQVATLLFAGTLLAETKPQHGPLIKLETMILTYDADTPPPLARGGIEPSAITDTALSELLARRDVEVLSEPSVTTVAGQKTVLRGTSKVQYFERTEDGTFALKSLPEDESPGVHLTATAQKTTDKGVSSKGAASVEFDLQIKTLGDRQKIPGVLLDVGYPWVQNRSISTELVIPLNQWMTLGGVQLVTEVAPGKREGLLVLLRLSQPDVR